MAWETGSPGSLASGGGARTPGPGSGFPVMRSRMAMLSLAQNLEGPGCPHRLLSTGASCGGGLSEWWPKP